MKIGIISDIHDNIENLDKFTNWANEKKVDLLICAGDITKENTMEKLAADFDRNIYLVTGNAELYNPQILNDNLNVHLLGKIGVFQIDGYKIGLCHEPFYIYELINKRPDLDIIFYGHTHKPWIEERNGIKTINPGTLGAIFEPATFAIWNTQNGSLELKTLNDIDLEDIY